LTGVESGNRWIRKERVTFTFHPILDRLNILPDGLTGCSKCLHDVLISSSFEEGFTSCSTLFIRSLVVVSERRRLTFGKAPTLAQKLIKNNSARLTAPENPPPPDFNPSSHLSSLRGHRTRFSRAVRRLFVAISGLTPAIAGRCAW